MAGHVRGLVARGHAVEVWHPPTADVTYLPLADVVRMHEVPLAPAGGRRQWWERGPAGSVAAVERELDALQEHCRQCGAAIDAGGFDVVFAQEARVTPAPPLPAAVRMPAVLFMQQPQRRYFEQTYTPGTLPWIGSGAELAAGRWRRDPRAFVGDLGRHHALRVRARRDDVWAKSYARVLANSHFSRESILKAYGVDARTCYLGVDTALFVDRRLPRERFVVSLGEVGPQKNVEMAIRAVAALPRPRPPLVWVGNQCYPEYQAAMDALAERLGVEFNVRVRLSDAEVVDVLNTAWAMVYAPRLEPFGLAPLEANACGTPVVAVAEGGPRETVRDGVNGLLVESDPAAIGEALGRLFDDPPLARRLGEGGVHEVAERWTPAAATDRLERHLNDVLAGTATVQEDQ